MSSNIYIVDDEESVCCAIKVLLMTYGFVVKTFNSAQNFFDTIPNSASGCLLLDINMPGLDGWETQKRLLASGSKRPVIFVSANRDQTFADRALKVGAVGFLQKPFEGQTLVDLIKVALESRTEQNKEDLEKSKEAIKITG